MMYVLTSNLIYSNGTEFPFRILKSHYTDAESAMESEVTSHLCNIFHFSPLGAQRAYEIASSRGKYQIDCANGHYRLVLKRDNGKVTLTYNRRASLVTSKKRITGTYVISEV